MHLVIGSRGSDLALYQANLIASLLGKFEVSTEIKVIKTVGDKIDNLSFDKIEGKGFFTKELEDALLAREIDLAVHSLKDLSTQMPDGLKVGAYCNPEDPSELLLVRPECFDPGQELYVKSNCTIGTSSVRRQAQIAHVRSDLKIEPLRGNVPTRIQKLREGKYCAILIAKAGVHRLGLDLDGLHSVMLDRFEFIPAPGQGILTIEIRDHDPAVQMGIAKLNEKSAEETARLERGLLARFQGGCQLPLAVTSKKRGGRFYLNAFLGVRDGDSWGTPALFDGEDTTIDGLIEKAYAALSTSSGDNTHKKKVLITRSENEAAGLFENLSDRIEPIYYPVFTIAPWRDKNAVDAVMSRLHDFDWLVFTSKNSVRTFFDILRESRATLPLSTKIAAVGRKTAELLAASGIRDIFVPEREDSKGLIEELPHLFEGAKVSMLLPQGEEAPASFEDALNALGHEVVRLNVYKTPPVNHKALPDINIDSVDFFIFTSPLAVTYFRGLGHKIPAESWIAAIGQATAEALVSLFRAPDFVPGKADLGAIVKQISERI
ncbi:MAG: hydroxymethylbilane synthase [candidate division Zixibacteria bacterium RBG_16_53_22]|nr:MAG: hydroxymethylbilane synthase [candidate division Zixibacteria bacterium RBG_16_53_22]